MSTSTDLSASPATLTLKAGSSGTVTLTASSVGGFSGKVSLKVSGLPGGASASLQPASIGAAQTSIHGLATDNFLDVAAAVAAIPNRQKNWKFWNDLGMASMRQWEA